MSNSINGYQKIEGGNIRAMLRSRGLPGGVEKICCGGRRSFSRDYLSQLRSLKFKGKFIITERGVYAATIEL